MNPASEAHDDELLALDEALGRLERHGREGAARKAPLFRRDDHPEAAQAIGISHATAERHWTFARAWLHAKLQDRQ